MKILFFSPYPREGPSNRFRVEQYLPYLKAEGIRYSFRPFFNSYSYKILYKKGFLLAKFFFFTIFSFRRMFDVFCSSGYDLVFIHREVFPLGSFMESLLKVFSRKIVYDFDDAIFLPNVSDSNRLVESLKDVTKTEKIIKISNRIIAGNIFLRDYAIRFNNNVSILPTCIDTDKYRPVEEKKPGDSVVVGWIGSVTTLRYLDILSDVFLKLLEKYSGLKIMIVGGKRNRINSPRIVFKEWRLESEISDLQSFDIGIMPLDNDEWAKGKCAFKVIEYMAVGIPVVASAIGMNSEVIQDGINGFLASTQDEWFKKISLLIDDA
ncbi:MAG: glycosyltransferase family 4 protein, partial [Candidatus Omnitrophota bacterium]